MTNDKQEWASDHCNRGVQEAGLGNGNSIMVALQKGHN